MYGCQRRDKMEIKDVNVHYENVQKNQILLMVPYATDICVTFSRFHSNITCGDWLPIMWAPIN